MAELVLLGTGAALSDALRENTYMVVKGETSSILVDCAGSPIQRLLKAGVDIDRLDHIVLTHHHPDHIYGLSVFLLDLWLKGRKKPLHIYGLTETLRSVRGIMHAFEWERWREHGFYAVEFHRVPAKGIRLDCMTPDFSMVAAPTKHLLPTIGLAFMSKRSGKSIAYSSDTVKSEKIVNLARGASILLHESTTIDEPLYGHSSARQAGQVAQEAGVGKLVLVHLPPDGDVDALKAAAKASFSGAVIVAKDFMRFKF